MRPRQRLKPGDQTIAANANRIRVLQLIEDLLMRTFANEYEFLNLCCRFIMVISSIFARIIAGLTSDLLQPHAGESARSNAPRA